MDAEDDDPELETVVQVKALCEWAGYRFRDANDASLDEQTRAYERKVYEECRDKALNEARTLRDEFHRDAALHQLIKLSMQVGDFEQAKKLFAVVDVDMIREVILEQYPQILAKF
jgi:hypothetical protein